MEACTEADGWEPPGRPERLGEVRVGGKRNCPPRRGSRGAGTRVAGGGFEPPTFGL